MKYVWIAALAGLSAVASLGVGHRRTTASDHFLTIGGGYAPSGNQVSLEKNVLLFQRVIKATYAAKTGSPKPVADTYFADGNDPASDLQVIDPASIPEANRWMAELFGDTNDLGLFYRNHQVPGARDAATADNVRQWFDQASKNIKSGDRLFVYVTAHGTPSSKDKKPFDTEIALWENSSLKMSEFSSLLDKLPDDIDVVVVMVQCYAGGFSRFCYVNGDPKKGLAKQRRVGFFATVHDRPAAGCTPDVDETNYVEYSTYFWAAIHGTDRSGDPIELPDYDNDGKVGFNEAHAYTVINAATIDIPLTTSSEYLNIHSRFAGERDSDAQFDLLANDETYSLVLPLGTPAQQAILEGLSSRLGLDSDDRITVAWEAGQPQRGRRRPRARRSDTDVELETIRKRITSDLIKRWPELANVMNPVAVELVTSRADEFVRSIKRHPKYARMVKLMDQDDTEMDEEERQAMHMRFIRVVDDIVLAENLRRLGDRKQIAEFGALIKAEAAGL
ncbi:hypothetical protein [Rubripirellula reticaptiva]|uniref:Caspase domain protein n=1 Tax=Rubripirellula reticaptiva TaxID=2528013 RepID=A0A5C6F8K0_9BACT|nr:hypothetical protein [Rubripirellula reticaptiva]TWU58073.1 hypothetical protein Poly59_09820 [Rubripirellula reticaptiva]